MPDGTRVYAVGDIHGRYDVLREMDELIINDYEASGAGLTPTVVYLGDYVDRGFQSRELLDHFVAHSPIPYQKVFLLGNHDQWFLKFLEGEDVAQSWLRYGGDATLLSYGIRPNMRQDQAARMQAMHTEMVEKMPSSHKEFLTSLEYAFAFGDYFFCHAGVRPDLPLSAQQDQDLIWIREPFLSATVDYGKIIVHGHTVEEAPAMRKNRIGVDTGAYQTGNLTCVVLEENDIRFLSTGIPTDIA